MNWRTSYQQGSFRGVPFKTEEMSGETGRRAEVFEYPKRDDPYVEDLGRKARTFSIQCFVAGDDYKAARDRLIDACEAEGSGTLVHPTRGTLNVNCLGCSWTESAVSGGICTFTLEFVVSGAPVSAPAYSDSGELLRMEAAKVESQAPALFAGRFSVAGMPDFVESAATDIVSLTVDTASLASALQGGVGPALHAFESGLRLLPADAASLARTPLNLARSIVGFMGALSALGGLPRRRIEAFKRISDKVETLDPVLGATPPRERQRANQDALQALILTATASGMVRAIGDMRFTSYDEAASLRDEAADHLDRLAILLASRFDDDSADYLDALRRTMIRDVTARGGSLARIFTHEPLIVQPVQTLAQRVYGAPDTLVRRCGEIIDRNALARPGFVPARALELAEGSANP